MKEIERVLSWSESRRYNISTADESQPINQLSAARTGRA
jgi:hypothetical protein